jgi:hypothetical protein
MTAEMTARDLARTVAKTREAQRKYFRTRAQGDLNESKRLERELDGMVADLLRQPTLFDRLATPPQSGEGRS